jgi:lipopolysaccharide export system permease protein
MLIIDRYILTRFAVNFITLFSLLFAFAVAIDVILNLDRFVDPARDLAGSGASLVKFLGAFALLVADFQGPRVFQFYAYLHGLAAVGAMAFTLANMHRNRELAAVLASGVSLRRIAMPFIIAMFCLSVAQLLNQELLLPKVAPLVLRDYGDVGRMGVDSFPIRFTPDGAGNLLQAPKFDPHMNLLSYPTILQRDERGRTVRRVTAHSAVWSADEGAWRLQNGQAIRLTGAAMTGPEETADDAAVGSSEPLDWFQTNLTPHVLLLRRYNQFVAMLSLQQIRQMLDAPRVSEHDVSRRASLLRQMYARLASVLANMLVLGLSLPCFLLREPANLLRQSVLCAGMAIPATVGSAIGMMMPLPGVPPAAGVFLPVIVLLFALLFPWTFFKT